MLGGKGEKSKTENEEIIGRHGEGMKIGALGFVRSNKKEKKEGKILGYIQMKKCGTFY